MRGAVRRRIIRSPHPSGRALSARQRRLAESQRIAGLGIAGRIGDRSENPQTAPEIALLDIGIFLLPTVLAGPPVRCCMAV